MLRSLITVWAIFDVLLLAAAITLIVLPTVCRRTTGLLSLVFMPRHYNAAFALGVLFVFTFCLSIPAITSPVMKQRPLVALGAMLLFDTLFTIGSATCVWLYSLGQRAGYAARWAGWNDVTKALVEDKWKCCGYWNASSFPRLPAVNATSTPFCADPSFAAQQPPCVTALTAFTDSTLENTFSTMYGLVCITIGLGLATACIVYERKSLVRFRKIDSKRGGSGFV